MRIRAAVTRAAHAPMSFEDLELDDPRDAEVRVSVVATGVCHTDVGMRDSASRAPKPIVLGHEGAGVVESIGRAVTKVKPGDHVVMTFNSCGACRTCRQGEPAYCYETVAANFAGRRGDGSTALRGSDGAIHSHFFGQSAFATHAICSERNVVRVPDDVPLALMGPFGCGMQTGAGAVINALRVPPGASIAVLGVGSVGLAAVMAAKICGAGKIIAVDLNEARLETAMQLGATDLVRSPKEGPAAQLMKITGAGLDFALDTTGSVVLIRQAVECLAPRGTCGLISSAKGADITLNVLQLMLGGRVVRGIVQGDSVPESFIPMLIEFHRQGRFPVDKLVSFYLLEEINQAMQDMERGVAIKPVIRMPGT